ncbi:MAG: hypothetical protein JWO92_1238 [Chitinophagaceae bacterium]|nr:hypothetical protein [Chitinophagaceae bacterium]
MKKIIIIRRVIWYLNRYNSKEPNQIMNKIISSLLLLTVGCNNNAEKNMEQKNNLQDTTQTVSKPLMDTVITKGKEIANILYEYKNDTLLQTLTIKYLSKQDISFELASVNKVKNKTSTLTGIAKGKPNRDPEMDEDEEGNAYAATEYHYNKEGCSLSIRIAMGTKDKAQIMEYNCGKLHDSNCPFEFVGLLRKARK